MSLIISANTCDEEGATLIVTDINKENLERAVRDFGAETVAPDQIYDVDCDIFSPCALGAIINDDTIPPFEVQSGSRFGQ